MSQQIDEIVTDNIKLGLTAQKVLNIVWDQMNEVKLSNSAKASAIVKLNSMDELVLKVSNDHANIM